jgi:hypothetical protein
MVRVPACFGWRARWLGCIDIPPRETAAPAVPASGLFYEFKFTKI